MLNPKSVLVGVVSGSLASLTIACGSQQAAAPRGQPMQPASGSKSTMPHEFTLDTAVQAARADAAAHGQVPAESLVVISAESVTWPDASIGCPAPGMVYTQVLVPGFRIRLRGPQGELDYHASRRGGLVLCPAKRAVSPPPGGGFNSRI